MVYLSQVARVQISKFGGQCKLSKLLFELRCLCMFPCVLPYFHLSEKKLLNGCTYQKMLLNKVITFLKKIKMTVLFFDFFGSDPSKMDQT